MSLDHPTPHGVRAAKLVFTRLTDGAVIPTRAHATDAGFDLRSLHSERIPAGEHRIISTGIACALPPDTVGLVYVRSGLGFKHHITLSNAVGVVDAGYRGELKVSLHNAGAEEYVVEAGDRVAQLVVTPLVRGLVAIEADSLPEADRGEAGFGSTGR